MANNTPIASRLFLGPRGGSVVAFRSDVYACLELQKLADVAELQRCLIGNLEVTDSEVETTSHGVTHPVHSPGMAAAQPLVPGSEVECYDAMECGATESSDSYEKKRDSDCSCNAISQTTIRRFVVVFLFVFLSLRSHHVHETIALAEPGAWQSLRVAAWGTP